MPSGRCVECKRTTDRLGPHRDAPDVSTWLCADCEYLRGRLDAPKVKPAAPRVEQAEQLFAREQYRR